MSFTKAAHIIIYYEATNHRTWMLNFVMALFIVDGIDKLLKLFCDNKSVVLYSNNNRNSTKSKHIEIKFLVVKEFKVDNFLEYICINSTIVNPLTKGLPPKMFYHHDARLGVMSLKDIQFY